MRTESNKCFFCHQWSEEKTWFDRRAGGCLLHSQSVSVFWLYVEEKLAITNDLIGYFKPFRGHPWLQKMTNFVTALPILSTRKNEQYIFGSFVWKQKNGRHMKHFKAPSIYLHCGRQKCMVLYVFALTWIFTALEKMIILLLEENKPIINIWLKDISNS